MRRPAVVTVFGILNIVFAALALSCMPFTLLFLLMPERLGIFGVAMLEVREGAPAYHAWLVASNVLGILAAVVLLFAGIGLLKMKSWGRSVSIGYAIFDMLRSGAGLVFTYAYVVAPVMREENQSPFAAAEMMSDLAGGCIALIYPVVLLSFLAYPS